MTDTDSTRYDGFSGLLRALATVSLDRVHQRLADRTEYIDYWRHDV
jgi:hypothetical protein